MHITIQCGSQSKPAGSTSNVASNDSCIQDLYTTACNTREQASACDFVHEGD